MNIRADLQAYGISGGNVRTFGTPPAPDLIDYLDLIESKDRKNVLPGGVAESQGRPLLFFIDESHLSLSESERRTKLNRLRRNLACRGERAYLASDESEAAPLQRCRLAVRTIDGGTHKVSLALAKRTIRSELQPSQTANDLQIYVEPSMSRAG